MKKFLKLLRRDEKGATMLEYCLLAAVIAVGLISIWRAIGFDLRPIFQYSSDQISDSQDAVEAGAEDDAT